MNDNLNERNSAPTGASDIENKEGADRPLGGASCCASSLCVTEEDEFVGDLGESFMKLIYGLKKKYPTKNITGDVTYNYGQGQSLNFSLT